MRTAIAALALGAWACTIVSSGQAAAQSGRSSTYEAGVMYRAPGQGSYRGMANSTAQACRAACVRDARCRHWVYLTALAEPATIRRTCTLYATPPVYTPVLPSRRHWIIAGRVLNAARRRASTYEPDVVYMPRGQTYPYRYLVRMTAPSCRAACLGDRQCRHWSYLTALAPARIRNSCSLYQTAPVRTVAAPRHRGMTISGRIYTR